MGHKAGWLTLMAGLAGGADIVLIPEIPYDIDSICQHLTERRRRGKWFSILAVAEGAVPKRTVPVTAVTRTSGKKAGKKGSKEAKEKRKTSSNGAALDAAGEGRVSSAVAKAISRRLGIETRVTVLGHLQRGGVPTPFDRILATRFGAHAAELLAEGKYNRMVCLKGSEVTSVPMEDVAGKLKLVTPDHPLLRAARHVGTNFGD
jgi:6-phosphofructokinase 1